MLDTAIILAGGLGTRLKSIISDLPKPMAPVNGVPFLTYQFRYLKHYGIKKVILSVGHLAEKIEDYYKSDFEGMNISYAYEKTALGTGGGIRLAIEGCGANAILVLNGDSFFDVNIKEFFEQHNAKKSDASLALRRVDNAARYGTIQKDDNNRITLFNEKSGLETPGIINGGVYILQKEIYLNNTPRNVTFSIEKDFFEKSITKLFLTGFEFNTYFIDIGIPEDYAKAQHDFKEFKY